MRGITIVVLSDLQLKATAKFFPQHGEIIAAANRDWLWKSVSGFWSVPTFANQLVILSSVSPESPLPFPFSSMLRAHPSFFPNPFQHMSGQRMVHGGGEAWLFVLEHCCEKGKFHWMQFHQQSRKIISYDCMLCLCSKNLSTKCPITSEKLDNLKFESLPFCGPSWTEE